MKKSLFWSITNPKNGVESYVFGTMHRCSAYVFEKVNFIDKYLEKVDKVVFEIDLSDSLIQKSDLSQIPDQKTVRDYIPSSKYSKLKDKIKKYYEVDLDQLAYLRPIFINAFLQERLLGRHLLSMDELLYQKAIGRGLPIVGLESQDDNLKIFGKIDIRDEIDQLLFSVKHISKARNKLKTLEKAYIKEDIQKLYRLSRKDIGNYKKLLLYDRNTHFVVKLSELGENESLLVCVGAGHLSGKFGILRGMKNFGFKVKPLNIKVR